MRDDVVTDYLRDIVGTDGSELLGRKILLGVAGSVAAYRAPDIARLLMRHGANVWSVMSEMAEQIIHPNLLEWATGNPVITKLTGRIEHVQFTSGSSKVDLVLIAPCTANTVGKIASGVDDTPITTFVSSALGADIPIVIALAMHDTMYRQPIVRENIQKLSELGVVFVEPTEEEGKAKLASLESILQAVLYTMPSKDYAGRNVLVTLGPTIEHVDPVRVITNPSTGKMGSAIAFEAQKRGASVTIVHGPVSVPLQTQARRIGAESTTAMYEATMNELRSSHYYVVFATAAPADYAPVSHEKKIATTEHARMALELNATPKIIDEIKRASPNTFLAAFRAQAGLSTDEMISDAKQRLRQASADLIAVNDVGRRDIGFGSDFNEIVLIDKDGSVKQLSRNPKKVIAKQILDEVSNSLRRTSN